MRISEVCARAGVSDKTVRFYIEKGLLKNNATRLNGRNCRDYNEEDIRTLEDIISLRNAGFSIQDILDMQNDGKEIDTIIERRIVELEREEQDCRHMNEHLQKVRSRRILSWRKAAELLRHEVTLQSEDIILRWPEDEKMPEQERLGLGQILRAVLAIVSIFLLVVFVYCTYQASRVTSCVFTIGEVTFHDKWWEDGKMYVLLSCNGEYMLGYDYAFASPQTVEIVDEEYYSSILLEEVSYQSVTLQIEVSQGDAYWDGLFADEEKRQWINIEKILQDESLIKQYCKLVAIYSEDKR